MDEVESWSRAQTLEKLFALMSSVDAILPRLITASQAAAFTDAEIRNLYRRVHAIILTFSCPICLTPSDLVISDDQAVCGNDECHVMTFDPSAELSDVPTNVHWIDVPGFME